MNKELHDSLNEHLTLEFGAFHQYQALSIWFDLNDLPGFAAWMKQQSSDELAHAQRFVDHLVERDLAVVLPALEKPSMEWPSARAAVEAVLASEQQVTASIEQLYAVAEKAGDRAATILLDWFISEQVEEENAVRALLGRLRLAGDNSLGLLLVDQELATGKIPGAMEEPAAGV